MKFIYAILSILLLAGLGLLAAGQAGMLEGKAPQNLGVVDGKLRPPSDTPNSVSSQADLYPDHPQKDYARIAPFTFSGDGQQAMQVLAGVLAGMTDTRVVKQEADYIYAQSTTALMRYTDDLEFWLDSTNNVIQVRSASRLGKKDLGKNRERMESIRELFGKALAAQ
jgi:uncharacterized protein (DUF1499 family)